MKDWLDVLDYDTLRTISNKLVIEREHYNIFPKREDILNAFVYTDWDDVKVVILGQDPYPTINHAHGLAFSVNPKVALPKSLINIYKELKDDLGITRPNGSLIDWAEQGVLLLNTTLTVREGQPNSHANIGWEQLTNNVIQTLSNEKDHLVFILWGNHAIQRSRFINKSKHFIITSVHPSPLSAHRGFFGSKPFSRTNDYLVSHEIPTIRW